MTRQLMQIQTTHKTRKVDKGNIYQEDIDNRSINEMLKQ